MNWRMNMRQLIWILSLWIYLTVIFSCTKQIGSTSDQANVFGQDERIFYSFDEWPWSTFGRLDSGCSGVAVSRFLVLTAAHCVWDSESQSLKVLGTEFDLQFGSLNHARRIPVETVWIGNKQPEEFRENDWAILRLTEQVNSPQGFLAIHTGDIASVLPHPVQIVGYMEDCENGARLCGQLACELVKKGEEGRILNNCDTVSGVSGSPVLADLDGFRIVGMAVSEYRQGAAESLKRDQYSDDYANVAISSQRFYDVLTRIEQAIESGQTIPFFDQVSQIDVGGTTSPPSLLPPEGMNPEQWIDAVYRHAATLVSVLEDLKEIAVALERPQFFEIAKKSQTSFAAMAKRSASANSDVTFELLYGSFQPIFDEVESYDRELSEYLSENRFLIQYQEVASIYSEYSLTVDEIKSLFGDVYEVQ